MMRYAHMAQCIRLSAAILMIHFIQDKSWLKGNKGIHERSMICAILTVKHNRKKNKIHKGNEP